MFVLFYCIFPDSPLSKLCFGCIHYNCEDIEEPFGCLPSTTLVVQVKTGYGVWMCKICFMLAWYFCINIPMFLNEYCSYINFAKCMYVWLLDLLILVCFFSKEMLCNAVVSELIGRLGIQENTFIANHPGGAIGSIKR